MNGDACERRPITDAPPQHVPGQPVADPRGFLWRTWVHVSSTCTSCGMRARECGCPGGVHT